MKQKVKIRPAVEADCDSLAEIEQSGAIRWGADSLRDSLAEPYRILIAESDDGRPLGFIVAVLAPGELQIANIVVDPRFRRSGVGSSLLKAMAAKAYQLDSSSRCFLEVAIGNDTAVEFYKSLGFATSGRRRSFYSDGQDALVMSAPVSTLAGKTGGK